MGLEYYFGMVLALGLFVPNGANTFTAVARKISLFDCLGGGVTWHAVPNGLNITESRRQTAVFIGSGR